MIFARLGRITVVLASIVLIVAGMIWLGNVQDRAEDPQTLTVPVNESDWFQGGKDAQMVLVEYSDFQCPSCAAYFPVLTNLERIYGDNLKIVYRHFPLSSIHPHAKLAAQAAEAAGKQGQFFAMHDYLFLQQKTWSNESDPTNTFISYAETLRLNKEQFIDDLTSATVKDAIAEDILSGNQSNVDSTPTFFLNNVMIEGPQGMEAFQAVIDAALAKTTNTTETL